MTTKLKCLTKKLISSIKVLALFLSIWTMTFSTVALGAQSEKRLKDVQNFILDSGLSKKTTYKEFWNKTKHIYPGEVYKKVEKFFLANPNAVMPKFAVREVTNSKGEKTISLSIDAGGKSHQVQILAEQEKWATFDNVTLTPSDVALLEPALNKIEKGMQPKSSKNQSTAVKSSVMQRFDYPSIDKTTWKKMTPIERAQHVVYLRALWSAAEDVIEAQNTKSEKSKTSSLDKWNLFIKFLVEEAVAKGKAGDSCIIAGYTGQYGISNNKLTCQYPDNKDVSCSLPCSPMIYGYADGGKTICVPTRKDLQTATDFNGYCDKNAPLSVNRLHYPKPPDKNKTAEQYLGALDQNKAQLMSSETDKKLNLEMTEKYLKSHLAKKDSKYLDMFQKGDFTDDLLKEIKNIESAFESQITIARHMCTGVADGTNKPDPNFYKACDQLHKRFLLVREYFSDKCPSDAPINSALKCECSNKKTLNPNSKETCNEAPAPVVVVKPEPAPVEEVKNKCPESYSHLELTQDCKCVTTNSPPVRNLKSVSGESEFTCAAEKDDKAFNWKPLAWIAGGIGVAALLYFLFKKDDKDKKKPRPPVIPPPVNPPPPPMCTNMCEANSTRNDTTCVCTPNWTPANCAVTYDAEFCPNEGGSGDSCPSGDCNGGVPGAVN